MRTTVLISLLFIAISSFGQKPPAKFGDIPKADLEMKVYSKDSSAAAVVLFDYGIAYMSVTQTANLFVERHTRIKILKKEGLKYADAAIRLLDVGSSEEKVSNLKAVTYNLENGKVVETSLSKDGIFKEKFNKISNQLKFTLPNVKEGSVIEFSYKIQSDFLDNFPNWAFQRSIPVRHSEYWAMIPEYFFFEKYMQGYVQLSSYSADATTYYNLPVKAHHYTTKDVPAFKPEPFMTSEEDYISKINFALAHYQFPGGYLQEVMSSWEKLNVQLLDDENFGKIIKGSGFLKDEVERITAGKTETLQKIEAISNHIRKNFEWDEDKDYLALPLKKIIEKKKGSSGDINLLMASMLEKADVPVDMVLLSTRDHGFIRESYPMRKQFNYVVCAVKIGDKTQMFDATEKYLPYDVLPSRCLNGKGLRISKTNFGWVEIASKAKEKTFVSANFSLDNSGELKGKVEYIRDGYDAHEMRSDFFSKGEEAFAKEFLSGKSWAIEKREFKDMDDLGKSAKGSFEVSINEHATSAGDVIYINPFVVNRIENNPFKSETRVFPVDFGNKIERVYSCRIAIPEGFTIDELPQSKAFALPDNAGRYIYNMTQMNNTITFTSNFTINKSLFVQDDYHNLKEFYNQVVAKQAEQIVLKKK